MEVKINGDEKILYPEGRISVDSVKEVEKEILGILEEHQEPILIFDLERVEYVSSAGLRLFLKLAKQYKDNMTIRNVPVDVYEVFAVTGFTTMMKVEKQLREISVEGCKVLGKGAYGAVYRVDNETIVKVYKGDMNKEEIEEGQKRARYALQRGVPTAIAFDRVRVNGCDGAVFELLDAKSFQEIVRTQPERLEEMTGLYVEFLRQLHDTTAEKSGDLEDAREVFQGILDQMQGVLPEDMIDRVRALFREMPEDLHIVHGDLHMKNLMYVSGEPMVIDMDTLCVGDFVFELGRLATFYKLARETDDQFEAMFYGFPEGTCDYIWDRIQEAFTEPGDSRTLDKIMLVGYLNLVRIVIHHFGNDPVMLERGITYCIERLSELLPGVESLALDR